MPETGRGFAASAVRDWWALGSWWQAEVHPCWWKFGIGFQPHMFGVYVGPLVIGVGKPRLVEETEPYTVTITQVDG